MKRYKTWNNAHGIDKRRLAFEAVGGALCNLVEKIIEWSTE
jgi:hypothetical protein